MLCKGYNLDKLLQQYINYSCKTEYSWLHDHTSGTKEHI